MKTFMRIDLCVVMSFVEPSTCLYSMSGDMPTLFSASSCHLTLAIVFAICWHEFDLLVLRTTRAHHLAWLIYALLHHFRMNAPRCGFLLQMEWILDCFQKTTDILSPCPSSNLPFGYSHTTTKLRCSTYSVINVPFQHPVITKGNINWGGQWWMQKLHHLFPQISHWSKIRRGLFSLYCRKTVFLTHIPSIIKKFQNLWALSLPNLSAMGCFLKHVKS